MKLIKCKIKRAFTLAEVLITLSIIGVVAALTIPVLINNVNKAQYVTALQKNFAVLQQAFLMLKTNNGGSIVPVFQNDTTTNHGNGSALNVFLTQLNYSKNCANDTGCWYDTPRYYLNGTTSHLKMDTAWSGSYEKAILANGTMLIINILSTDCTADDGDGPFESACASLSIDVNGAKGPNTIGRDFYSFTITQTGIYPSGSYNGATCGPGTDFPTSGGCAAKILKEGVMNY